MRIWNRSFVVQKHSNTVGFQVSAFQLLDTSCYQTLSSPLTEWLWPFSFWTFCPLFRSPIGYRTKSPVHSPNMSNYLQLSDLLSSIQVIIQLTDHSDIGILLAIWLPDMSANQMQWLFEDHIFHGPVFNGPDHLKIGSFSQDF